MITTLNTHQHAVYVVARVHAGGDGHWLTFDNGTLQCDCGGLHLVIRGNDVDMNVTDDFVGNVVHVTNMPFRHQRNASQTTTS